MVNAPPTAADVRVIAKKMRVRVSLALALATSVRCRPLGFLTRDGWIKLPNKSCGLLEKHGLDRVFWQYG